MAAIGLSPLYPRCRTGAVANPERSYRIPGRVGDGLRALLTPERRRRAVAVLSERFGVSERRACKLVGQHRSTQRCVPRPPADEETKLRRRLRAIARGHPRWSWRTAHRLLAREGWSINHKRIQRLWREERLRRPARDTKTRRLPGSTQRLRAEHPNHVWAIDFQFDETEDGRRLKLTNIVDEHTQEALEMRVGRTCTAADDVVASLDKLVGARGAPVHIRMDNGPELIAWALKDWCRLSGTGSMYIEPGSPWENPFVESFNVRVRDELLNVQVFGSLAEAQVLVEAWRVESNTTYRPHSSLGWAHPR